MAFVCMGFQVIVPEGLIHEDLRAIFTSLNGYGLWVNRFAMAFYA